ncbi:MAG: aminotransferase class V-fold PLP-dependent enzyme [Candidatus Bathyarchaeota archaeon]|nr:MAG: aminotransferase class V-fold PLP-dependent enzyme [Candidatus Bathyarchaeota archaeon]
MENIERIREDFPVTKSKLFLNHSGYSPLPQPVADVMKKYNEDLCCFEVDETKYGLGQEFFAELIGAAKEEIALVPNTSTGLNIAANTLDYSRGSNVVTTDLEYPSVVYPWLKKSLGVNVEYVKNVGGRILVEDIEKVVTDETVAIAVSHVEYVNGFKHDLKALAEIAHEHGAYLIVDGIQALGVIPVDVKKNDVDFLTASCYKWLLGPAGSGYLYVRRELLEELEPPFIGWASVKPEVFDTSEFWDIWRLQLSETASRFEVGAPSFISFVGAATALQLLQKIGIKNIQRRVLDLTEVLLDAVKNLGFKLTTPEDEECRSAIVHFLIANAQEIAEELKHKGIIISARSRGLRVSPHFYNTEEEIEKFISELKAL